MTSKRWDDNMMIRSLKILALVMSPIIVVVAIAMGYARIDERVDNNKERICKIEEIVEMVPKIETKVNMIYEYLKNTP